MIQERAIAELVVGYPLNMNGSVGFKAREVDAFIKDLEKRFQLPVHRIDERLSSHAVEQGLRGQKKKPDRKSGRLIRGQQLLFCRILLRSTYMGWPRSNS